MKKISINQKNIGIGICCLGIVFLAKSMISQQTEIQYIEPMVGISPVQTGTELLEKMEDASMEQTVFSILTFDMGTQTNPLWTETKGNTILSELLFEPLAQRDVDGNMYPILAQSIANSVDGMQMKITIKDDVLFSDGTPMDIQDVEESLLLSALLNGAGTENIAGIDAFLHEPATRPSGIEVVDETTLIITFDKYDFTNRLLLETPIQKMVPMFWDDPEIRTDAKLLLGMGVGTNAYVFAEQSQGVQVLTQNEHYRDKIQDIDLIVIYDVSVVDVVEMVDQQQIDYFTFAIDTQLSDAIFDRSTLDIYTKDENLVLGLIANPKSETAMTESVNGLIQCVIDRTAMFSGDLLHKIRPETSLLPKLIAPNELPSDTMDHQMALSHQAVAVEALGDVQVDIIENGDVRAVDVIQPDGMILLRVPILAGNDIHKKMGNALAEQLEPYGISVQLNMVSEAEYYSVLYIKEAYDFYFAELQEQHTIYDIDSYLYQYGTNIDADIIGVVKELSEPNEMARRQELYTTLQRYYRKNSRFIPLGRVQEMTAVSTSWSEYVMTMESDAPFFMGNAIYNVD